MNAPLAIALLALLSSTIGCTSTAAPAPSPLAPASSAASPHVFPVIHKIDAVARAKRAPPAPVPPVVVNGVRYSAPHFKGDAPGMAHSGGYLEAAQERTGQRLWLKEIYRYTVNPNLEGDVQDVFVESLRVDGGALRVRDEGGVEYLVPLGP